MHQFMVITDDGISCAENSTDAATHAGFDPWELAAPAAAIRALELGDELILQRRGEISIIRVSGRQVRL
jgi:hypothetical protein